MTTENQDREKAREEYQASSEVIRNLTPEEYRQKLEDSWAKSKTTDTTADISPTQLAHLMLAPMFAKRDKKSPLHPAFERIMQAIGSKVGNEVTVKGRRFARTNYIGHDWTAMVGDLINPNAKPEDAILSLSTVAFNNPGVKFCVEIAKDSPCNQPPEQWKTLFEKLLGLKHLGETTEDAQRGNIPKGGYFTSFFEPETPESGSVGIIHVDRKSLLEELGIADLNIEAGRHAAKIQIADAMGVDYTKYLELRGEL